ncbi:predicted protein [Naegleria gruberi]|uniref:Predicted protein n=1 Tax=Naegleria gruberi TaxID=5762 RepID=D2VQJ4_NAEGR|nr:uncharacterized protein NAEGRDRAFT_51470 [Naegleria gruberi]EFC40881.1 predicted protein [Naegleria gruberi]|eukprot:XP_002673625.1 predicted protein [Naegleria gruberi strain NEG-M]
MFKLLPTVSITRFSSNHHQQTGCVLKKGIFGTLNSSLIGGRNYSSIIHETKEEIIKPFALPFSVLTKAHPSSLVSFENNIKHMRGINLFSDENHNAFTEVIAQAGHHPEKLVNHLQVNRQAHPLIYPFNHSERNNGRLVVCLLGWLGSNWKHVDKFVNWYDYCNIETLSTIPPILSTISPSHTQTVCEEFVRQMEEKILNHEMADNTTIIFHVFSGNGIHMFSRLLENEKFVDKFLPRTKGFVVDSAPPMYNYERFTEGFVGAIKTAMGSRMDRNKSRKENAPSSTDQKLKILKEEQAKSREFYKHWLLTPVVSSFFKLYFNMGARERFERLEQTLVNHTKSIPKLFIYSHGDVLIPHSDIDFYLSKHFVEERLERLAYQQEKGQSGPEHVSDKEFDEWIKTHHQSETQFLLDELVFHDSDHVYHFKEHPREYSERVLRFIHLSSKK